jgi:hypothetical protein
MNPLVLAPLLEFGSSLLDRFIPNKEEKAKAELELLKLTQSQDFQKTIEQLKINAQEAAHPSIWVAGWRPFIGWGGGFGFFYHVVIHNILEWVSKIRGWPSPPVVDTDLLLYVLGALLGVGTLRTVEKLKKVTK